MRVFVTRWFGRFARSEGIPDSALSGAIRRAEKGLAEADLGGGLLKLRIAREGRGRSAGYRVIVVFRSGDRTVFLFGFAKSDRDNIGMKELADLRVIGRGWLAATERQMRSAIEDGAIREVPFDEGP